MSKETVINPEKIMGCVSILKQLLDQDKTQDIIDLVNKVYLQPKLIDPRFEFTSKTNIIILFTAEANLIGKYLEEGNRSKIKKLIELFTNIGDAKLTLVQIDVLLDIISQKQEFLKTHQLYVNDMLKILEDVFSPCVEKFLKTHSKEAQLINERLSAANKILKDSKTLELTFDPEQLVDCNDESSKAVVHTGEESNLDEVLVI
jgi:hypothetical protein